MFGIPQLRKYDEWNEQLHRVLGTIVAGVVFVCGVVLFRHVLRPAEKHQRPTGSETENPRACEIDPE